MPVRDANDDMLSRLNELTQSLNALTGGSIGARNVREIPECAKIISLLKPVNLQDSQPG